MAVVVIILALLLWPFSSDTTATKGNSPVVQRRATQKVLKNLWVASDQANEKLYKKKRQDEGARL